MNLEELNINHIIIDNVIDMNNMFSEYENLKNINLSNFNTNNVINMEKMFSYCKN